MDLSNAIQQHVEWRIKLRNAIQKQDKLDVSIVSCHDCCELGKWLQGAGKAQYGTLPSFSECVSKHTAFHAEAGKVAATINQQQYAKAEEMLHHDATFSRTSSAVSVAITRLKLDAGI